MEIKGKVKRMTDEELEEIKKAKGAFKKKVQGLSLFPVLLYLEQRGQGLRDNGKLSLVTIKVSVVSYARIKK